MKKTAAHYEKEALVCVEGSSGILEGTGTPEMRMWGAQSALALAQVMATLATAAATTEYTEYGLAFDAEARRA